MAADTTISIEDSEKLARISHISPKEMNEETLLEYLRVTLEPDDNPFPEIHNYINLYKRLYDWASNSLDSTRSELLDVCFAVFVEMYAKLLHHHAPSAAQFMTCFGLLHEGRYRHAIAALKVMTHPSQLADCSELGFGKDRKRKRIYLSKRALRTLHAWLVDCNSAVLLNLIQDGCELCQLPSLEGLNSTETSSAIHFPFGSSVSYINRQPIEWGLPKVLYQEGKTGAEKEAPSKALILGNEPTVLVEPKHLPPLPEPGTDSHTFYRSRLKVQASRRAILSETALPHALCYTLQNSGDLSSLCISNYDGSLIAAGYEDSIVRLWNLSDYEKSKNSMENVEETPEETDWSGCVSLIGHDGPIHGLAFGECNRILLSAGSEGSILLWSVECKTNHMAYRSGMTCVWSIDFAPYGYYFASGESDGLARLWVTERSHAVRVFSGHTADVDCVKFHPNSGLLLTSSSDASLRLWDIRFPKCVRLFYPNKRDCYIRTVAISPNGRLVASAGTDNLISLWDIPTGSLIDTLPTGPSPVRSLNFCYGSTLLASGNLEGVVTLWNVSTAARGFASNEKALNSLSGAAIPPQSSAALPPLLSHVFASPAKDTEMPLHYDRVSHVKQSSRGSVSLVKQFVLRDAQIHHVAFSRENVLLVGAVSVQYRV
ncbi:transcription initiation factor TFIID subunit TAF5 [Cardiosporidium cionae]|uniref:Transcription initiation factor TFIID subunit TAF5 n=1 Tax=Cardiosporidium cionae TaxID=476202 RepID=A0ABQ7J6W1_9APIC|nr:transcription initiation factor TFIID subunit TAF5 [Cardiosporidium cionae]|eukprot:KAF8819737.1 transcription initiation factor TFIID subunit TAF5 [Cardiosporidium cionae]